MAATAFSFFGRVMIQCWNVSFDATYGGGWVVVGGRRVEQHRARKKLRREATEVWVGGRHFIEVKARTMLLSR